MDRPDLPVTATFTDADFLQKMRATAVKLGVNSIDKTAIIDLLKDGDRVTGAIGFNIIDGACHC